MFDGVNFEIDKYTTLFEKNYPGIPFHFIGFENIMQAVETGPLLFDQGTDFKHLSLQQGI